MPSQVADVAFPGTKSEWPTLARRLRNVGAGARILYGHTTRYVADDRRFFRLLREAGLAETRLEVADLPEKVSLYELSVARAEGA